MQIRVGYEFIYSFPQATPMILTVSIHYSRASDIVTPDHLTTNPSVPVTAYRDGFGNWCSRIVAPAGRFRIEGNGMVRDTGLPDVVVPSAPQHAVKDLPEETLVFLLGSRYCETDLLSPMAWQLFGKAPRGWPLVQAICDYVHGHIAFDYQTARSTRTAWEVYNELCGVCRDYAHLAIALCRCMNIPARYCTGYLGDMGMPPPYGVPDFAAWFEVFIGRGGGTVGQQAPRLGLQFLAFLLLSSAPYGAAGLGADRRTRHYQFNPAVDLPAGSRIVGAHRLGLAEALGGDRIRQNALGHKIGAHGLRTLVRQVLIVLITPDVVRMAIDFNVESRVGEQNASDLGQLFPRSRLQRESSRVKQHVGHINNQSASAIPGLENRVQLLRQLGTQARFVVLGLLPGKSSLFGLGLSLGFGGVGLGLARLAERGVRRYFVLGRLRLGIGSGLFGLFRLPVCLVCLGLCLSFGIGGNLEFARLAFLIYLLDGNNACVLGGLYSFTRIGNLRLLVASSRLKVLRVLQTHLGFIQRVRRVLFRSRPFGDSHRIARLVKLERDSRIHGYGLKFVGIDIQFVLSPLEQLVLRLNFLKLSLGVRPHFVLQHHHVAGLGHGKVGFGGYDQAKSLQIAGHIQLAFAILAEQDFAQVNRASLGTDGPQDVRQVLRAEFARRLQALELRIDMDCALLARDLGIAAGLRQTGWCLGS